MYNWRLFQYLLQQIPVFVLGTITWSDWNVNVWAFQIKKSNHSFFNKPNQINTIISKSLKSWYLYSENHITAVFEMKTSKSVFPRHVSTLASLKNEIQKGELSAPWGDVKDRCYNCSITFAVNLAEYISLMFH